MNNYNYILFIILILLILFVMLPNSNIITYTTDIYSNESFDNMASASEPETIYYKCSLLHNNNNVYNLVLLSHLNIDIQKNILNLMNDGSIMKYTLENTNLTENTNSSANTNYYKNLIEYDFIKRKLDRGLEYFPANDIIVAVNSGKLLELTNKSLLFDKTQDIYYKSNDNSKIDRLTDCKLSLNYNILMASNISNSINNKNMISNTMFANGTDTSDNYPDDNNFIYSNLVEVNDKKIKYINLIPLDQDSLINIVNISDTKQNIVSIELVPI